MPTNIPDAPHQAFQEYGTALQALQHAREALEEVEIQIRAVVARSKSLLDILALVAAHDSCKQTLTRAAAEARRKFLAWIEAQKTSD